jgi:hypothetical protein
MNLHTEHVGLSWKILEAKFYYYEGPKYNLQSPWTDSQYDEMERRYNYLCEKLNKEPTASGMVGFDINRGSCRLVAAKILKIPLPVSRSSIIQGLPKGKGVTWCQQKLNM